MVSPPAGRPFVLEDVDVPLKRIHQHVGEVLRVLALIGELHAIAGLEVRDFEDVRHRLHLICCLVLRHADQVLVEVLRRLHVLRDALLELVHRAA